MAAVIPGSSRPLQNAAKPRSRGLLPCPCPCPCPCPIRASHPEARLVRKGHAQEPKLSFHGHALIENRHGLLVSLQVSHATGYAEREVALEMLYPHRRQHGRVTVGADRAYDTRDFVESCRAQGVTPHVAKNEHERRRSALDQRTTRHVGYRISQRKRMRIEQVFGWTKVFGGLRKVRVRGVERIKAAAHLVGAAYKLVRIVNLRRRAG